MVDSSESLASPLSFTEADIVDKIKWLIAHDHIAKKITKNAENFGKSYLRLEDYYCYVATALDTEICFIRMSLT
jgi:hypothetical protein